MYRRPRRPLVASTLLVALCSIASTVAPEGSFADDVAVTTCILVRHAEAGKDDPRDPSLAESGRERAQALARMLAGVPVTHLFASEYKRTQETLAPLSEQTGVDIEAVSARDEGALVARLDALPPGSVVVLAGHSNTVPSLAKRLGCRPSGLEEHPQHGWLIPHDEYDRMYMLTRVGSGSEASTAACLELRYGAP